jgi:hypothetical protein
LRRVAGAQEPPGGRLTDHVLLGVLSAAFSRDLIEEVIDAAGKREKRSRLLPVMCPAFPGQRFNG